MQVLAEYGGVLRGGARKLTPEAAVGVRGAISLAAQELARLELVLRLAIGTEGEELIVQLAGGAVPHAFGAKGLEDMRKVGRALRHTPIKDGRSDCTHVRPPTSVLVSESDRTFGCKLLNVSNSTGRKCFKSVSYPYRPWLDPSST